MMNDKPESGKEAVALQPEPSAEAVRAAIAEQIAPMEPFGLPSLHDGEWRSLVAVAPRGPMILMGFKVSPRSGDCSANTKAT